MRLIRVDLVSHINKWIIQGVVERLVDVRDGLDIVDLLLLLDDWHHWHDDLLLNWNDSLNRNLSLDWSLNLDNCLLLWAKVFLACLGIDWSLNLNNMLLQVNRSLKNNIL